MQLLKEHGEDWAKIATKMTNRSKEELATYINNFKMRQQQRRQMKEQEGE